MQKDSIHVDVALNALLEGSVIFRRFVSVQLPSPSTIYLTNGLDEPMTRIRLSQNEIS